MIVRNEMAITSLSSSEFDAELLQERDIRRCYALYSVCTPKNWKPTTLFNELMYQLRNCVKDTKQIEYKVLFSDPSTSIAPSDILDGALHFTFLQFLSFNIYPKVKIPADYNEVVSAIIVNWLNSFEIQFHSVVVTPKSVLILGSPSTNINSIRDHTRRELKREGMVMYEPYLSNLVHMTIMRFATALSESQMKKLVEISQRFRDVSLGTLYVSQFNLSPASWKMQPEEISIQPLTTISLV